MSSKTGQLHRGGSLEPVVTEAEVDAESSDAAIAYLTDLGFELALLRLA